MTDTRNWPEIKAAYLAGGQTVKQLAARFDLPTGTIYARAKREHWKTEQKTQEGQLQQARECVDLLLTALQQALRGGEALQSTRQVKCKGKTETPEGMIDRNWVEEEATGEIDIGRIKDFTVTLDSLVSLKRDLYDLPTGAEAERRMLAKEKLEMARQKMLPTEAPPLQVVFSDELLAWSD